MNPQVIARIFIFHLVSERLFCEQLDYNLMFRWFLDMKPEDRRVTVGADKSYDDAAFIEACRVLNVTPHVAQNEKNRASRIDGRTTQHPGYILSQWIRKRVEEIFGWFKTVGNFRRTRFKGRDRTEQGSYLVATAYNLLRMARLMVAVR